MLVHQRLEFLLLVPHLQGAEIHGIVDLLNILLNEINDPLSIMCLLHFLHILKLIQVIGYIYIPNFLMIEFQILEGNEQHIQDRD